MTTTRRDDDRRLHRIAVDVLATPAQVLALQTLIGEAICGAPDDHDGPCRIAWTMGHATWDEAQNDDEDDAEDDVGYGLDAAAATRATEELTPIEVWRAAEVDRSLGLETP